MTPALVDPTNAAVGVDLLRNCVIKLALEMTLVVLELLR